MQRPTSLPTDPGRRPIPIAPSNSADSNIRSRRVGPARGHARTRRQARALRRRESKRCDRATDELEDRDGEQPDQRGVDRNRRHVRIAGFTAQAAQAMTRPTSTRAVTEQEAISRSAPGRSARRREGTEQQRPDERRRIPDLRTARITPVAPTAAAAANEPRRRQASADPSAAPGSAQSSTAAMVAAIQGMETNAKGVSIADAVGTNQCSSGSWRAASPRQAAARRPLPSNRTAAPGHARDDHPCGYGSARSRSRWQSGPPRQGATA